ncbi:MAG: terpene cyclase/mutase family protein [Planctomycetes bacterium]|nr:terpene cyclase/mutase family protein [Planctomycetota bacterium]
MCLLILPVLVSARQLAAQDPAADNPLKNREKKNRSAALKQFGGTKKTERAVADGLEWLADHQRRDGVWDRKTFDQCCPADDRCTQTAIADLHREADVGVSAMAALAFLGAGYTHENGPYGEHLSRVFSYILAQQSRDGSFSAGSSYQNYNDAIAAIAIAESYILTKDPILRRPLERVIDKLVSCQQREGGWDLTDDISTGRNDSSVSSWVLMACKSARAAGVGGPLDTRIKLLAHYDHATLANGRVWHANKRERDLDKPANPRELDIADRGYGPGSTATGLYARAAFGLRLDDPLAEKQVDLLLAELPSLKDRIRPATTAWHNEYYWYYGTMAMFNVGGEPWRRWNEALRTTILEQQERPVTPKGKHRHSFGSWPAFGPGWGEWGRSGGRIYATAINVLTLEIYYRYIPAYLSPQDSSDRSSFARSGNRSRRATMGMCSSWRHDCIPTRESRSSSNFLNRRTQMPGSTPHWHSPNMLPRSAAAHCLRNATGRWATNARSSSARSEEFLRSRNHANTDVSPPSIHRRK